MQAAQRECTATRAAHSTARRRSRSGRRVSDHGRGGAAYPRAPDHDHAPTRRGGRPRSDPYPSGARRPDLADPPQRVRGMARSLQPGSPGGQAAAALLEPSDLAKWEGGDHLMPAKKKAKKAKKAKKK